MTREWGNWTLPAVFIAGVFTAHLFHLLPPDWIVFCSLATGLILVGFPRLRLIGLWLLAMSWTLLHFGYQVDQRLDEPLINQTASVSGQVIDLPENYPDYTRFRLRPDRNSDEKEAGHDLPDTLLVYWYRDRPEIRAGQMWRLDLQLKPPWGRVNFLGYDREKWLFAERIGALATVRNGEMISEPSAWETPVQQLREQLRNNIGRTLTDERAEPVIRALAVADRSGLSDSDQDLLVATGTSHLLAISGLHIGLAALAGTWMARLILAFIPALSFSTWGVRLPLVVGLLAAVAYAALAGWGVSTQRALLMISVMMAALMVSRAIDPIRSLLLALCLVLLLDPLAPLGAGFWFSFVAVAALIAVFAPRPGKLNTWQTMLLAQAGIMVAMIPVSLGWFQVFSPVGFLANLIAIPMVSLLIVPLTLAAICLFPISSVLAGLPLKLAAMAASGLMDLLQVFATLQGGLTLWPTPGTATLFLATMGGFLLLLPRGLPHRWLGVFLFLPLFLPAASRSSNDSLQMEALDVGQGTSLLISTPNHSLLYDSGPGDGNGRDLVRSVIVPAVTSLGPRAPEVIMISHGDLDHAGGLKSLANRFDQARWVSSLPIPALGSGRTYALAGIHANRVCEPEHEWSWDGIQFRILHPSPGLPYRGNDSSCVLSIDNGAVSLLLPGDISSRTEKRLIAGGLARHRLLLVPHHGSKTSSNLEFLNQVRPELAIATAGLGNRFGFPRPQIRDRYHSLGIKFLSTADCGAIRVQFHQDEPLSVESARRVRQRIWRWPATEDCP